MKAEVPVRTDEKRFEKFRVGQLVYFSGDVDDSPGHCEKPKACLIFLCFLFLHLTFLTGHVSSIKKYKRWCHAVLQGVNFLRANYTMQWDPMFCVSFALLTLLLHLRLRNSDFLFKI